MRTPPLARPAGSVAGAALPLVEELCPAPEPWDAFERILQLPKPLFLDSSRFDPELGRYSFLAADPFEFVTCCCAEGTCSSSTSGKLVSSGVFQHLEERLSRFSSGPAPGLPPFQGGLAGLFAYDLCHHLERLPHPPYDEFRLPDLAVGFYDWVLAFDHQAGRAWVISQGFPETDRARRVLRADRRLRSLRALLRRPSSPLPTDHPTLRRTLGLADLAPQWPAPGPKGLTSNFSHSGYLEALSKTIAYIYAGDIFQANLSQRLLFPASDSPAALYRRLRDRNPANFSAYFDAGGLVVVSASPERFLQVRDRKVQTRPIKGTRPRSPDPVEDEQRKRELALSVKDRAENVMIVDLLRNDLSRVSQPDSVVVDHLFRIETVEFVHHLVSVVSSSLDSGKTPLALLQAAFPGGSVTGAPKVRAMEIIAELEPTARGPYCGCLGYLGFDASMDTSILIRAFTCSRGWLQFPVGGGIVSQSDLQREYEETRHKAEGLIRSLL
jgi:para-aminobenzoate synthetase component 1